MSLNFELNAEQLALQKAFREFAQKEIKPLAFEREKLQDPKNVFPVSLFEKSFELDLHKTNIPEEYGGMGLSCLDHLVIWEELAAADTGFCVSYQGHAMALAFMMNAATKEQNEKWLRPLAEKGGLVAVAVTEPNTGPSWMITYPGDYAMQTTAKREGDEYVLNGSKNFCTNGDTPLTAFYTIHARTNMEKKGMEAHDVFLVSADAPGLKFGPPEQKMGQRLSYNASFFLDNVHVPMENLIGGKEGGTAETMGVKPRVTTMESFTTISALMVGLARAAYEQALDYANKRMICGNPAIGHQLVGAKLARMYTEIQAARALIYSAARQSDSAAQPDMKLGWACKVFCSDVAVRTVSEALQIHGGYGYSKEMPIEKLYRDAKITQIYECPNEALLLGIAMMLQLGM